MAGSRGGWCWGRDEAGMKSVLPCTSARVFKEVWKKLGFIIFFLCFGMKPAGFEFLPYYKGIKEVI